MARRWNAQEKFGAQPPLEILRQFLQYEFWYDLKKQTPKFVRDTQLVAAMGHPGGGRTTISARTLHCFSVINATFPAESQVRKIFGTLINTHLMTFDEDIKPTGPLSLWGYMRYAGGGGSCCAPPAASAPATSIVLTLLLSLRPGGDQLLLLWRR